MTRKEGERMNFARTDVRKDLIDLFLQEVNKVGYCGTSLKTLSWSRIIQEMNTKYNKEFDQKQLKNQWDYLRKSYSSWRVLENRAGHGYNAETGTFDWPNHVWEDIIKKYPDTKKFRYKPLEDRESLKLLFESTFSTGDNAVTPTHQIPKENPHNQDAIKDEEKELFREDETKTLTNGNQSDGYFIEYNFYEDPPLINSQEQGGQSDAGSSRAKRRRKTSEPVEDSIAKDFHDLVEIIKNDHCTKGTVIVECTKALRKLKDSGKLKDGMFFKAIMAFSKMEDCRSFFLTMEGDDEKLDFVKAMLGNDS